MSEGASLKDFRPSTPAVSEPPAATHVFPAEAPDIEEQRNAIHIVCLNFWPTEGMSIMKWQLLRVVCYAAVDNWLKIQILQMAFKAPKYLPQTDTPCIFSSQGLECFFLFLSFLSSFNLSSNVISAGHLSSPLQPGEAHHGLPTRDKLLMTAILVTFDLLILIHHHWTVSSMRAESVSGSPAPGRLPGTQWAHSEC